MATAAFYTEVRVVIAQAYRMMRGTLDGSDLAQDRDAQRAVSSGQNTANGLELDEITDEVRRKAVYSLLLAGSWR
jgi:hypothetical protein